MNQNRFEILCYEREQMRKRKKKREYKKKMLKERKEKYGDKREKGERDSVLISGE